VNENALTPETVRAAAQFGDRGRRWLDALPALVDDLSRRWSVEIQSSLPNASCSFVARVCRESGEAAVLKVPIPHREAEQEAAALCAWDGECTVTVFELDASGAMLLELADPGGPLADQGDPSEIARTGGALIRRLHRLAPEDHPFEMLGDVCREWAELARDRVRSIGLPSDRALIDEGADLLEALPGDPAGSVLLHGDFHHWNVLSATREPWLVIDAKPMVGDPVFDAARFLENHYGRVHQDPVAFARDAKLFAEAALFDFERTMQWTFARCVEDSMWELSFDDERHSREGLALARLVKELLAKTGN
jgi:streptomycin 6-kinase